MAATAIKELDPAAHLAMMPQMTLSMVKDVPWVPGVTKDLNFSSQAAEGQAGHLITSNVAPCRDNQSVELVQPAEWVKITLKELTTRAQLLCSAIPT